ncbi:SIR2 family protein [Vibrio parahaemolyticus]|uniref:SIR2 family protein n=1 Tax=Vibrio harveyi group TaxID=717610 RepID=UPI001D163FA5|nr:SIR2 family protein [Vibrio parahaemolyticus]MCC3845704.1 SIR2 family protein [Vibrio parahaemolyticus]MDF4741876.1 SIR2 family protein [Vibrio parahaemolyticus]
MLIEKYISMIDEGGPKSYYSFETLVQHLLKEHVESQKKPFHHFDRRKMADFGDAIAPEGFDDFDGSTLIEIKFNLDNVHFKKYIERLFRFTENNDLKFAVKHLIIISAKPIPARFVERYGEILSSDNWPFKVSLWGPKELNVIVEKHKSLAEEIANNLFLLRLDDAIKNQSIDWKQERISTIEKIASCYKRGQFSLILGAGVSSSAGMPDWNTLLNSLFVRYMAKKFDGDKTISDRDITDLVQRLNVIDEPSALMAARYLRRGLSHNGQDAQGFIEAVTDSLYKLRNTSLDIDSPLIKSLSSMCIPKRTGAKIKSVVTYNFDDLLERQLSRDSIQYRSIYTENENYDPDDLPVYHAHGFLPEDQANYQDLEESTLVFSEEGYHHIYSNPYHWSNLVQLNTFRENNCLMVGLSMTDPNLRRLLDISSKNLEHSKHFAFMKRLTINDFCFDGSNTDMQQVIGNIDSAEKFLTQHHTLNEELMRELGVTIVWYENYTEIPEAIDRIVGN